jgi:hypothetical protein
LFGYWSTHVPLPRVIHKSILFNHGPCFTPKSHIWF